MQFGGSHSQLGAAIDQKNPKVLGICVKGSPKEVALGIAVKGF